MNHFSYYISRYSVVLMSWDSCFLSAVHLSKMNRYCKTLLVFKKYFTITLQHFYIQQQWETTDTSIMEPPTNKQSNFKQLKMKKKEVTKQCRSLYKSIRQELPTLL